MIKAQFILYVKDQTRSTEFYRQVLNLAPTLNVPGMTEFTLADQCVLGLMPEAGIKRLLGDRLPDPAASNGRRCDRVERVARSRLGPSRRLQPRSR